MFYLYIILSVPLSLLFLWCLVSPQGLWWKLHAPFYRNPAANEPSELGYWFLQLSGAIGLVACTWFVFLAVHSIRVEQVREQQIQKMEQMTRDLKDPKKREELRRKYNLPPNNK